MARLNGGNKYIQLIRLHLGMKELNSTPQNTKQLT